jgi:O-antigen/teichoic acid export membrane protein
MEPSTLGVRRAIANVLFKATAAPLEKVCRFAVVVVAAPVFGTAVFGTYQYATTVTALLAMGTEFGLGMWTTRAVARDPERAAPILSAALRARVAAALPYLGLLAIIALLQPSPDARLAMVLLGGAALANALVDFFGAALRGYEAFRREAGMNAARAMLTAAGAIAGLRVTRAVGGLATGLLVGATASAILGAWLLRQRSRASTRKGPPRREGGEPVRVAFAEIMPLWLAGLLSTLYFRCDVVILQALAGAAEVGAYAAAYRMFEAIMVLPAAIMSVAFPKLVRDDAKRGYTPLERRLAVFLTALGVMMAGVVYVGSDRWIGMAFGPGFALSVPSLRVLALALPFIFANFALTFFLFARGRERSYLAIVAVAFVLNVGFNLAAIPRWGGTGAAWATLVTEAALAAACLAALGLRNRAPRPAPIRPPILPG